jgi:hypothetical protein
MDRQSLRERIHNRLGREKPTAFRALSIEQNRGG